MSLSQKALLANLHIAQWAARKLDKKATSTVEATHTTRGKVGQYTKKLLPNAKELEEVVRAAGAARSFFYEQTLPWFADGSRIISSKNYMDFTSAFRSKKADFDSAKEKFLAEYPRLKEEARAKLGDLFNENDYPSATALEHTFSCEISFMPVPDVKDFRVEILDSEKNAFEKRMKDVEKTAMDDIWHRLHDVVSKAASRLAEADPIFRDSLIGNISDLCQLLPKLNVMDDPKLETMRQELEKVVANIVPENCRASSHARKDAASNLAKLTDKMSVFMQG